MRDIQCALSRPASHPARQIQLTAISDAEAEALGDDIPTGSLNSNHNPTSTSHLLPVACVCFPAVPRVWENGDEITDLRRNFRMGKAE